MKEESAEVKMRKVVDGVMATVTVDEVTVPVYETVEELSEAFEPAQILAFCNAQNKANITNKIRASHREKTAGKGKRREIALNILKDIKFENGKSGLQMLTEAVQSETAAAAIEALFSSPEVEKAVDAELAGS